MTADESGTAPHTHAQVIDQCQSVERPEEQAASALHSLFGVATHNIRSNLLGLGFQHVSSTPDKAARCNSFAKAGADALVLSEHICVSY